MKAVCEAGGVIPSALDEGRTVGTNGKFSDLTSKIQSSACTTARAMTAAGLAMIMPDDPISLMAASLENPQTKHAVRARGEGARPAAQRREETQR